MVIPAIVGLKVGRPFLEVSVSVDNLTGVTTKGLEAAVTAAFPTYVIERAFLFTKRLIVVPLTPNN